MRTPDLVQASLTPASSPEKWTVTGLLLVFAFFAHALFAQTTQAPFPEVHITEAPYEGADHFVIHTPSATYWYDKAGGGLSRLIDRDGQDWIAFRREPWNQYPAAAASSFRGLPNFVFRGPDGGAGHPGHTKCRTEQLNATTLRTTSLSEKWQWEWTFFEDHAQVSLLRTDPEVPYWLLYEGTPGGTFDPPNQYFGTDTDGPRFEQPDYYQGDKRFEPWRWAYFGHKATDRVLFLAQQQRDTLSDTFSYLGNSDAGIRSGDGMVVFGFGRAEGATPLMHGQNRFVIGFWEEKVQDQRAHRRLGRRIRRLFSR